MDISIYTITHRFNQRFYLGYSQDTERRFRNHRSMLRRGAHHCIHLQRAWNLDGESAFDFRRLETCASVAQALDAEQKYLDAFYSEGRLYNSVGTNDPALVIRRAHGSKALAAASVARRDSIAFKNSSAMNRRLALTPAAQAKRIATTTRNDSWCASQRTPVRAIRESTGEVTIFRSLREAATAIGAGAGNVSMCCNGLRNRVNGHLLSFAA